MSKTKIKLLFKNVQDIWSFAQHVHATNIEINTADITLICDCTEADEAFAVNRYGATKVYYPILTAV